MMLGHLLTLMTAAVFVARADLQEPPATEQHRPRVLLLLDAPTAPLMGRIEAEIAALGWEPMLRPALGRIEDSARAEGAVAAIRALPSGKGVEVWMADETSGRSLLRQVIVDESPGGPSSHLIALQTAELLRTSLVPPPSPTTLPPPPGPPGSPASVGESALASGLGMLHGGGGTSPSLQAWLAYQHLWRPNLGLALQVSAPLRRGTLTAREGSAEIGALTATAELLFRFTGVGQRLFLIAGAGGGLAYVTSRGHPREESSAQLVGRSSSTYSGLAYGRAIVGWSLASWLRVGLAGLAGTTVRPVHVRFAANDAGEWGLLLVGASVFAEVRWR